MELLNGFDLGTMVERFGPLPPERAVYLLRQACDSLALDFGLVKPRDGGGAAELHVHLPAEHLHAALADRTTHSPWTPVTPRGLCFRHTS